jgi:protein TonB
VRRARAVALAAALAACGRGGSADAKPGTEMPIAINGESPFQYPADLFDQGVEGEVRLRLYVDAAGQVVAESTRVASSSGTPAFDSAAVLGAAALRFAPARREGKAVVMAFYQPVIFRRPSAPQGNSTP